jgi:hypothetical protein
VPCLPTLKSPSPTGHTAHHSAEHFSKKSSHNALTDASSQNRVYVAKDSSGLIKDCANCRNRHPTHRKTGFEMRGNRFSIGQRFKEATMKLFGTLLTYVQAIPTSYKLVSIVVVMLYLIGTSGPEPSKTTVNQQRENSQPVNHSVETRVSPAPRQPSEHQASAVTGPKENPRDLDVSRNQPKQKNSQPQVTLKDTDQLGAIEPTSTKGALPSTDSGRNPSEENARQPRSVAVENVIVVPRGSDISNGRRVPSNAHIKGNGWECDRGFFQASRDECVRVQIPANAHIDVYGHGWDCDRGFSQLRNECVRVQIPDNASLDVYGHGWDCNRGFSQSGGGCVRVQIPDNASLDVYGHGWDCNRGFSQSGGGCVRVQIPDNAHL